MQEIRTHYTIPQPCEMAHCFCQHKKGSSIYYCCHCGTSTEGEECMTDTPSPEYLGEIRIFYWMLRSFVCPPGASSWTSTGSTIQDAYLLHVGRLLQEVDRLQDALTGAIQQDYCTTCAAILAEAELDEREGEKRYGD